MIQPKPFMNRFKLRNQAFGIERRRNMSKIILEKAPNFPLTVEYKDIDESFKEWVENDLDLSYDGKKLPTFRLFSNQRINEYAQSWQHLDETGNLLMNFKTITRENNPKHGENQGSSYNIPGDRDYPMFMVPVLQENGQQAYDMYSMKQPFCVDIIYTVALVTNKYELLNEINQMVLNKFKSINCYIAPNNHFMPMVLENISDESEYNLNDVKYYSQSFQIKIKAYIITKNDYKVTKLPSRVIVRMLGINEKKTPKIELEEEYVNDPCKVDGSVDRFSYKQLKLNIIFSQCKNVADFESDFHMIIEEIKVNNVFDFVICLNGEKQNLNKLITIYPNDDVSIRISKNDELIESSIIIIGYDSDKVIDNEFNPESSLDEEITEEIIDIKS